ncbi:MAG: hypothetical protein ACTSQE_16085 [Candidatus Heimdallarchaeaceae archaeon]
MIEIYCKRGLGDKELSSIDDELIITNFMATKRGKAEIDKQWYLQHIQDIEVPFKKADNGNPLLDDNIVEISDPFFGISGKRKIKRIVISGTPSDLSMRLTVIKFEEFI